MEPTLAITAFEWLEDAIGGQVWTYPAIVVAVAFDSLLPLAPSEAMMITAGVLAANDELILPLVILAGFLGGVLGDNASYGLGASLGRRAERRFFSSGRGRRRLEWAREQLRERGAMIIVAARFIPGGRTATTFAAGTLDMPWRRFVAIDAIAAGLWSTYIALLGYFGGATFEDDLWKPLLAAGAVSLLVATAGELIRRAKLA